MPFRSNYRKVVLKKFPRAYYRLGESSGIVAADESGNGNAGTYVGGVTLGQPGAIAGDPNTAALFDGSTGWIKGTDALDIGLGSMSWEFWFQTTATTRQGLYRKSDGGNANGVLIDIGLSGPGRIRAHVHNAPNVLVDTTTTYHNGQWHHLVVVLNRVAAELRIYVDGASVVSVSASGLAGLDLNATSVYGIGTIGGGSATNTFNGTIDEVAVYNYALSAEEVLENYETGIHAIEYNVNIPCPPGFKEYDIFIRPDGVQYLLGDMGNGSGERRNVMSIEGDGMPPLQYITERSPYQDGETVRGLFLQPRIVQYLIRQRFGSRNNYWDGRGALMNAIRPNRGQGTLRRILSTGEQRDLDVYVLEGPQFRARSPNEWAEWTINEIVRFIAHNPVYYDPIQYSLSFTTGGGLTFPITFPITFAGFGFVSTINYLGSWKEYPTIRIDGPISSAEVINQTTGESIAITYALPVGRYIDIILTPGNKRILLDDGTDLIATLNANSDLATFHLDPGVNSIQVNVAGDGASTAVSILYYHRFLGVPQ